MPVVMPLMNLTKIGQPREPMEVASPSSLGQE